MSNKTFTVRVLENESFPGLHFNSFRVAVAERAGVMSGLVFADTKEDGEPGYFTNFVMIDEETGAPSQWVSFDAEMTLEAAAGDVLRVSILPVGELIHELHQRFNQIL